VTQFEMFQIGFDVLIAIVFVSFGSRIGQITLETEADCARNDRVEQYLIRTNKAVETVVNTVANLMAIVEEHQKAIKEIKDDYPFVGDGNP
jgi:hypothetical protein